MADVSDKTLLGIAVFVVLASLFWSWNGGAGFSAAAVVTPAGQACTDGDNGYDLNTASSCTWTDRNGVDYTVADACISDSVVYETFCSPSMKCGQTYMLCGHDQQCLKGKCV